MIAASLPLRPLPAVTPRPRAEEPPCAEEHTLFEKIGGVIGAATKIPFAILPCVVGGVLKSSKPDMETSRVAAAVDITNGVQSALGLTTAISSGGIAGFVQTLLTKGIVTGVTIAMVSRGGSSMALANGLERELAARLRPEDGVLRATGKGLYAGARVGLVGGARVGYSEGRGYALGLKEAGREVPLVLRGNYDGNEEARSAGWLGKATGAGLALLMIPPGLAQGLAESLGTPPSISSRIVGTMLALELAAAGVGLAGLSGASLTTFLVGGGIGTLVGLVTAGRGAGPMAERISHMVSSARERSAPEPDPVAAKNRNFIGGMLIGAAAGARAGYKQFA